MEVHIPAWFLLAVSLVARSLEALGVLTIAVAAATSTFLFLKQLAREGWSVPTYQSYRSQLGRGILVGLEFLVGADIINTVAIAPTLQSATVLGVIVLIRTFLSFSLEVEINGRWPWNEAQHAAELGDTRAESPSTIRPRQAA